MDTGPVKPKEYFAKLLNVADKDVDYSDNPPTAKADWENAEYLLPVTAEEFRDIERFIHDRRESANADTPRHSD